MLLANLGPDPAAGVVTVLIAFFALYGVLWAVTSGLAFGEGFRGSLGRVAAVVLTAVSLLLLAHAGIAMTLVAAGAALIVGLAWRLSREPHEPPPRVPVQTWRARGLGVSAGSVELQPGQRCPLCKDERFASGEAAECPECGAVLHLDCAQELGRCSTMHCPGKPRHVHARARVLA